MLEFLPDGVEVLLFSGNQIPVLDWNLFGIWDEHPKLEVIHTLRKDKFTTQRRCSMFDL